MYEPQRNELLISPGWEEINIFFITINGCKVYDSM